MNYENQHKGGLCKVLGKSAVFSALYADFCLCPKSVIITYSTGKLPESGDISTVCQNGLVLNTEVRESTIQCARGFEIRKIDNIY